MRKIVLGIVGVGLLTGALQARGGYQFRYQKCYNDWITMGSTCMVFKGLCRDIMVGNYAKMKHNCKDTRPYIWNEYKKAYRKYKK